MDRAYRPMRAGSALSGLISEYRRPCGCPELGRTTRPGCIRGAALRGGRVGRPGSRAWCRSGSGRGGAAWRRARCGRWSLKCRSYSDSTAFACRWLTMRIRSSSSRRRLPTNRSAMALARGARIGVSTICTPAEVNSVEDPAELVIVVPEEEPERLAGALKIHEQITGQLGQPLPGWVRGDPEDPHLPGGVLDDEEPVQPSEGHRLEVEQVASEDPVGLCGKELPPARSRSSRRRIEAGRGQNPPHGGGADPVAQPGQLALHAPVAPS